MLQLLASCGETNKLPEADWLRSKATQSRNAPEKRAWDPQTDHYYLLERVAENRWYHSGRGIDEKSRELDVTPFYAAFVSGDDARGRKVAGYPQRIWQWIAIAPKPNPSSSGEARKPISDQQ